MTWASTASVWLVHRAAGRWPVAIRDELLREWTAEVRTIARDRNLSAFHRTRLMLGFGISLALSRPGGEPAFAPLGWKRAAGVVAGLMAYLLVLAVFDSGWNDTFQSMSEGERPIIDDPGLPARLVQGAVALLPVPVAAGAGWWLGRRLSSRRVRPLALGSCLIAVVAAWAGAGFLVERFTRLVTVPTYVPVPSQMKYSFGNQPYGMVTSWVVWLAAFVLLAAVVRSAAGKHTLRRTLVASGVTVVVAGLAVVAGTFVQFGSAAMPGNQAWKWFPLWLVPAEPFETVLDQRAYRLNSARDISGFASSYPHVLLAVAAFGVAFLLASDRQPVSVNGQRIDR